MKKLFIIPIILTALCGCGQLKALDEYASLNTDLVAITGKNSYMELFDVRLNWDKENFPIEAKAEIEKLPLSDISLTQKGMPVENVKVYKNDDLDLLIATDYNWYEVYNNNSSIPQKFSDLVEAFREKGWHYTGCITGSKLNRLDFANDEYLLSSDNNSYFSITYDNVFLNSNNIPVGISLYIENNSIAKIYVNYYDLSYQSKELSIDNITMLRDGLKLAGMDNFDIIINQLQDNIKSSGGKNSDLSSYRINSLKPIFIAKDIKQGSMIVSVK
ncbi:MAG: hypothetical protein Q4D26_08670 [Clostridia bacterium]|nr:hypothetical protein [Clostridia bacterium]